VSYFYNKKYVIKNNDRSNSNSYSPYDKKNKFGARSRKKSKKKYVIYCIF